MNRFYSVSLHRQLLDEKIREFSGSVKGKVLDIGSRNRRYDSFFKNAAKIYAIDLKPQRGAGVMAADARKLPFASRVFDTVVSFEVLEYITETTAVLDEIARVLNKEGFLIFAVPFLDPVHGDMDDIRYTEKAWRQLLHKNFIIREAQIIGGRFTIIWDFLFERARNHYGNFRRLFLFLPLALSKRIAFYLDSREKSWRFPMGYFFVCSLKRTNI